MPDKTTRPLGYTELWERMRRVLAVEGNQTYTGWVDEHLPPDGHFTTDGQPQLLFGYVLEGLGITPEQVVADLLPHNAIEPREIFAAAGFPLTSEAGWLAEGSWVYEIRSVYWSHCIGALRDNSSDDGWVPQDALPLAEVEGTVDRVPVDVTAITATFPTTPPPGVADASFYEVGYQVWMEAAEQAGEGTTWTVSRSTFSLDDVPVDVAPGDDHACAAILVDYRWYVIERDGDTVRARLVPIDGDEDE